MKAFERIHNSCARCGRPLPGDVAYAENRDAAVAGMGICVDCVSTNEVKAVIETPSQIIIAGGTSPEKIVMPEGAVVVNLGDGVDDGEASVSGKALRRRRK